MFLNMKIQGFCQMMKGGEKVPEAQHLDFIHFLTSDIFHPGALYINAMSSMLSEHMFI